MAIKGQHNIVQFQITVYNAIFVEVFQRQADLGSVKSISSVHYGLGQSGQLTELVSSQIDRAECAA